MTVPKDPARRGAAGDRRSTSLFEPKRFNRVKPSRFSGWIKPEEHSGGGSKAECHPDGVGRNRRRPFEEVLRGGREAISHGDPEQPAKEAEDDGLDEKLHENVLASCSDGHAQS